MCLFVVIGYGYVFVFVCVCVCLLQPHPTSSIKVAWGGDMTGRGKMAEAALVYCELSHHDWYVCVAMKRHDDDNEGKQPDKRPRLHQVLQSLIALMFKLITLQTHNQCTKSKLSTLLAQAICRHAHTNLRTHSANPTGEGLGGIALHSGASAAELPPWPSHPEPIGCEPYGTTAVCSPARVGYVRV